MMYLLGWLIILVEENFDLIAVEVMANGTIIVGFREVSWPLECSPRGSRKALELRPSCPTIPCRFLGYRSQLVSQESLCWMCAYMLRPPMHLTAMTRFSSVILLIA